MLAWFLIKMPKNALIREEIAVIIGCQFWFTQFCVSQANLYARQVNPT